MATASRRDAEREVRSWGFRRCVDGLHGEANSMACSVFTWTDAPNAYYPPHAHGGLTTHLILNGSLTITYPRDESPNKETFGPGARVDVDARRQHEVWMGPDGCTYVIGE